MPFLESEGAESLPQIVGRLGTQVSNVRVLISCRQVKTFAKEMKI